MFSRFCKKIKALLSPWADRQKFNASYSKVQFSALPYSQGVDTTTLTGKIMCGYQGWFAAEGDTSGRGWVHFGRLQQFKPGYSAIDFWPDMSEADDDERYPTTFRHIDGEPAYVFSSYNRKTVLRHFHWMKEYGIDGIFLQRFGNSLKRPDAVLDFQNAVLANVQAGAHLSGRTWAIMYDLSGLQSDEIRNFVIEDWKRLVDRLDIVNDKSYLHHKGKPVVAIWGVGFSGSRNYSLDECEKLVTFLKTDKRYGNNTIMLGLPNGWRELKFDSVSDEKLHQIILQADIISPWTVGRYASPQQARLHAKAVVQPDIEWAKRKNIDYLPVVFPGFSWQNHQKTYGRNVMLNQISRLKGKFLWSQSIASIQEGADMLYVAMFDELDEGTAIFKCTNEPPVGESQFATFDGLPSDHYLWLTGKLGELLRGECEPTLNPPVRCFVRRK